MCLYVKMSPDPDQFVTDMSSDKQGRQSHEPWKTARPDHHASLLLCRHVPEAEVESWVLAPAPILNLPFDWWSYFDLELRREDAGNVLGELCESGSRRRSIRLRGAPSSSFSLPASFPSTHALICTPFRQMLVLAHSHTLFTLN
jgi:hypothetical protein